VPIACCLLPIGTFGGTADTTGVVGLDSPLCLLPVGTFGVPFVPFVPCQTMKAIRTAPKVPQLHRTAGTNRQVPLAKAGTFGTMRAIRIQIKLRMPSLNRIVRLLQIMRTLKLHIQIKFWLVMGYVLLK